MYQPSKVSLAARVLQHTIRAARKIKMLRIESNHLSVRIGAAERVASLPDGAKLAELGELRLILIGAVRGSDLRLVPRPNRTVAIPSSSC